MSAGADRLASSRRVRFAAQGLLAACVGDVRCKLDPMLEGEIRLGRGAAGVARVYDDAARAAVKAKGGK